jgi:hypothetical protein
VRGAFVALAGAAAVIRRWWLGKQARAELKRRRVQVAYVYVYVCHKYTHTHTHIEVRARRPPLYTTNVPSVLILFFFLQRARDALLAPALTPSRQPPLHCYHTSPCPPSTARGTDNPSRFRMRLVSTGAVTVTSPHRTCSAVAAESIRTIDISIVRPLRGCRKMAWEAPGEEGRGGGGDGDVEEEEVRERRLLREQQQRISEEIARAGSHRALMFSSNI